MTLPDYTGREHTNISEVLNAMEAVGLFPGEIIPDGEIHRFKNDPRGKGKSAWYSVNQYQYRDGSPLFVATFGDWKSGEKHYFQSEKQSLTFEEREEVRGRVEAAKRQQMAALHKQWEATAVEVQQKWEILAVTGESPYLVRKQIPEFFGARLHDDTLYISCRDVDGRLWTLQQIQSNGDKFFYPGGRAQGSMHVIGSLADLVGEAYITEGFATAASIHLALGKPTVVAFNALNLVSVTRALRKKHPRIQFIICGDDDKWTFKPDGVTAMNPGREKAEIAARESSTCVVYPIFKDTSTRPTDFNDLHCLEGLDEVRKQILEASTNSERQSIFTSGRHPWSPRKELPSVEVEVASLPIDLVPEQLKGWLLDAADRMQIPPEMLVIPCMVGISSIIGRNCGIYPRQRDSWLAVPNLWGAVIAPPGFLKSPALKEAIAPIHRLELSMITSFDELGKKRSVEIFTIKSQIEGLECQISDRFKGKKSRDGEQSQSIESLQSQLVELKEKYDRERVPRPRLIANDATIEIISEILRDNPSGLLVFRDELYGFLKTFDKPGRETDRQYYLEAWNGTTSFNVDRIQRGSTHVPGLCLSVLGGIQPDRLNEYFSSTIEGESGDDGFFSRFQLSVYPLFPKKWKLIDRYPDSESRDSAFRMIRVLKEFPFKDRLNFSGEADDVPALRFDNDAQELFNDWIECLENRIRSGEIASAAFVAHLSKYRSLMPSIALIYHLINLASGRTDRMSVSLDAAKQSAQLCDFLESHIQKIYSGVIEPRVQAAHALAAKIKSGEIRSGVKVRDIYRHGWSQLDNQKRVDTGLSVLKELDWIRICDVETGGRPSEVIQIHPDFHKETGR